MKKLHLYIWSLVVNVVFFFVVMYRRVMYSADAYGTYYIKDDGVFVRKEVHYSDGVARFIDGTSEMSHVASIWFSECEVPFAGY